MEIQFLRSAMNLNEISFKDVAQTSFDMWWNAKMPF